MDSTSFLKSTKGKIIMISGVAVAIVAILIFVLTRGDVYRSISVEQTKGDVNITGEKNNGPAYVGQHLYSGDDVTVGEISQLTMCMDNDKYVYADADTHFSLQASGAKEDSKIKILLDAGSELNELKSKLGENDTYEVDTPNSTMSVRGTTFRVTVYSAKDGTSYSLIEVTEGQVLTRLKNTKGEYNGEEKLIGGGESALVRGNADFSEFVTSDSLDPDDIISGDTEQSEVFVLSYDTLPAGGLERLIELLEKSAIVSEESDSGENTDNAADENNAENAITPTPETAENTEEDEKASVTPTVAATKHVHQGGDWVTIVAAGCETPGRMEQKCIECGEVMGTKEIPATGHVPGEWVTVSSAECESSGYRQQSCVVCGKALATENIPATGHNFGDWYTTEATCTTDGSRSRSCSFCSATETEIIPALGHDYESTSQQTSTHYIYTYTCRRCGDTYTESIPII